MRDTQNSTALHYAITSGSKEVVEVLLQDPKSKEIINTTNQDGNTAYHYACGRHHENIVNLLLEKGADCTLTNKKGETAIKLISNNDLKKRVIVKQLGVQQRPSDSLSSLSH